MLTLHAAQSQCRAVFLVVVSVSMKLDLPHIVVAYKKVMQQLRLRCKESAYCNRC